MPNDGDSGTLSIMSNIRVLVTGGTGFIGSALAKLLESTSKFDIRIAVRQKSLLQNIPSVVVGDITQDTDWTTSLEGIDVVVHTAARVHVMHDSAANPLDDFRLVNTQGTLNLAQQAVESGVHRFIFLSTIGVNGAETTDNPYQADDEVAPHSSYALSKYEAESGLMKIADQSRMSVVVIRPPLVYGAGAPGNWATLMRLLWRGLPLPLGYIQNKRSFVGLENLLDLIKVCIVHPAAANQIFLVSDNEDISTTELLRRISLSLGKSNRLLPVPVGLLKLGASITGKKDLARSLCGSLQVDISKTQKLLDWEAPVSLDNGIKQAAKCFLASLSKEG